VLVAGEFGTDSARVSISLLHPSSRASLRKRTLEVRQPKKRKTMSFSVKESINTTNENITIRDGICENCCELQKKSLSERSWCVSTYLWSTFRGSEKGCTICSVFIRTIIHFRLTKGLSESKWDEKLAKGLRWRIMDEVWKESDDLKVIIGSLPGTADSVSQKPERLPKLAFLYLEGVNTRHSNIVQLYAKSSTTSSSSHNALQLNINSFIPMGNGSWALLRCAEIFR
jgi:hypothetical protein